MFSNARLVLAWTLAGASLLSFPGGVGQAERDRSAPRFSTGLGISLPAVGSVEDVSCVTDPAQPHSLAVVARPSDVPARSARVAAHRNALYVASAFLDEGARQNDARRGARIRVLCEGGQAKVYEVTLPRPASAITEGNLVTDIRNALTNRGVDLSTAIPVASIDAQPFGTRSGLAYGGVAFSFRQAGWDTILHEWLHLLGAVQSGAPNATPAGHCTDGLDIMCYADGSGGRVSAQRLHGRAGRLRGRRLLQSRARSWKLARGESQHRRRRPSSDRLRHERCRYASGERQGNPAIEPVRAAELEHVA